MNTSKQIQDFLDKWTPSEREKRREPVRTHHLKCPHCGALALNLWHIYGQQYFKCDACGKKC